MLLKQETEKAAVISVTVSKAEVQTLSNDQRHWRQGRTASTSETFQLNLDGLNLGPLPGSMPQRLFNKLVPIFLAIQSQTAGPEPRRDLDFAEYFSGDRSPIKNI